MFPGQSTKPILGITKRRLRIGRQGAAAKDCRLPEGRSHGAGHRNDPDSTAALVLHLANDRSPETGSVAWPGAGVNADAAAATEAMMPQPDMSSRLRPEQITGLLFVLLLHAAAFYGLWSHRLLPSPADAAMLFVNFIAPPAPPKAEVPKPPPPKPRPIEKPQPRQLVAETPVIAPTDPIAPPPPPKAESIQAPPMPLPPGPVTLGSDLSLACPERSAPAYPALSRRFGETGKVVLRVELDEQGLVANAKVETASGFERLDHAALAAVKTWRCNPPQRNGQPTRAIAKQPFHFVLQGH